ncbi:MAG: ankyrin repeat domain-containing protein [Verrucomicrobia bacterium]|nr:ankyrin repeat domain-containing protein [Verrucomicrobiota bacterium]
MSKSLPSRPNLEQLKNQAKDLLKKYLAGEPAAVNRMRELHPDFGGSSVKSPRTPLTPSLSPSDGERVTEGRVRGKGFRLHDAQLVIAREYGFASWMKLKEHVDSITLKADDPVELFKKAFIDNDATMFRQLLERFPAMKAKINEPVAAFDAPVITQVRSREMLDVLLEAGADINAKSRWWAGGFGLLHGAKPDLAAYAIQRGAVVDVHAAARLGMNEKVRELISANPSLVNARGGDGQTPLHFASTVEIAKWLLDHGADIDARDIDHDSTPAQWMVGDRQEIARYLIQRGCKTDILMAAALGDADLVRKHLDSDPGCIHVRVSDEYFPMINKKAGGTIYQWALGWYVSPHDVAKQFGHDDVFRLLMERSPADVRLLAACWAVDETAVKSLLAQEPDLVADLSDAYHRQVAHAARNNNLAAVRVMLTAGLPVDSLGQHRATPLHWAAFHGNAELTREILRYEPPLELTDADFHSTPLGWAIHGSEHGWYCRTGDYATTVELLLKAGAKLPEKTTGGTEAVKDALRRHATKDFDRISLDAVDGSRTDLG